MSIRSSMARAESQTLPSVPGGRALTLWIAVVGATTAVFLALATASQTYLSMRMHGHSFVRILAWQLGCWSFWALVAPFVVRISVRRNLMQLGLIGLGLALVQSVMAAALALWLQPYVPTVSQSFQEALMGLWWFPFIVDPLVYALLVVGGRGIFAFEQNRRWAIRESLLEAQLTRAQLDALRLEIQPHFLFNTLNSIAALIRKEDNEGALSMLLQLGDLMRATLVDPVGHFSPIVQEVETMKRYIELHRMRFGERLTVTYRIDERSESLQVPTLILQPIIENALKHGLAPSAKPCHVEVGAALEGLNQVRMWVTDDGAGLPDAFDLDRHAGTGLRNTRLRLQCLYGQDARLTVAPSFQTGTTVQIVMPIDDTAAQATPRSAAL